MLRPLSLFLDTYDGLQNWIEDNCDMYFTYLTKNFVFKEPETIYMSNHW